MKALVLISLIAVAIWPAQVKAVLVVPMTFEQLVDEAAAVVQYLKGELGGSIAMRLPGGETGGKIHVIPGAPVLRPGELVVVFLKARGPAMLTTLGLGQGIFRVTRDARTGAMLVTPPPLKESAVGRIIRGAAERRSLSLDAFAATVRATEAR
jgi:hypothetical protein